MKKKILTLPNHGRIDFHISCADCEDCLMVGESTNGEIIITNSRNTKTTISVTKKKFREFIASIKAGRFDEYKFLSAIGLSPSGEVVITHKDHDLSFIFVTTEEFEVFFNDIKTRRYDRLV